MVVDVHKRRHKKKIGRYRAYLNGVEVKEAYYGDPRRGVIRAYATDANGQKYLNPQDLDDVMKVELRGKVRLVKIHD